jgi:hypothetical protein
LPEPYFAAISKRLWVETTERSIQPGVDVMRRGRPSAEEEPVGSSVALITATRTHPIVISVPHDERREPFLEIRTHGDTGDRVVTMIEVLSISNKTTADKGRELYLKKQREIEESTVHFVEIDLLRGGQYTTAVPRKRLLKKAGSFDYHVSVCPGDKVGEYLVYPFQLSGRIPEIVIPLLYDTPPVAIDLQPVFEHCYDSGPYRRSVRYSEPPVPPLRADQTEWAARLLRDKKLLPS